MKLSTHCRNGHEWTPESTKIYIISGLPERKCATCLNKRKRIDPALRVTDEKRFWAKVAKTPGFGPDGDCWRWMGGTDGNGYGRIRALGRPQPAHRYSYFLRHGVEIDRSLCGCHTCDNPGCVNPQHIFAGTHLENTLDKIAKGRHARSQVTHCANGHEYNEINTYLRMENGARRCRICSNEYHKAYMANKKLVTLA
jgi:hypothetical protein